MKKIFIAPIIKKNKYNEEILTISKDWINFFNSINFEINTSFTLNSKTINNISKNSDTLLICGGGEISKFSKKAIDYKRDQFEKKLLKSFTRKNKPILAVCRGFQLVASLNSGKFAKSKNHVRKVHYLKITKNNKYIKYRKLITNSYHKNVIKKIGKKFRVVANSNDGFIEIAEHINKKILCFMFHPERYNDSSKEIKNVIKNFLYGSSYIGRRKR